MDVQTRLKQAIAAAKNGETFKASKLLYSILDEDPKNEAAWVWLSYVVDAVEDRQVCLENVLTLNPSSQYAIRGLAQIRQLKNKDTHSVSSASSGSLEQIPTGTGGTLLHQLALKLTAAFWAGAGFLFVVAGVIDLINKIVNLLKSRTFPYYITPSQLWDFTIAVGFLILGILVFNIAWALFARHKVGIYASILFSLGLILAVPTALLISGSNNYLLVIFAAAMPTIVLFLTLISQVGLDYEQRLATHIR